MSLLFGKQDKDFVGKTIYYHYQAPAIFDRSKECARKCQGVATVMLAIASIEALLSDITSMYDTGTILHSSPDSTSDVPMSDRAVPSLELQTTKKENDVYLKIKKINKNRDKFENKVLEIIDIKKDKSRDLKKKRIWQDFKMLIKPRDEITHPKPFKLEKINNLDKIEINSKIYKQLIINKKIKEPSKLPCNLLCLLDDKNFTNWVIDTASDIYNEIINSLQTISSPSRLKPLRL